MIIKIKYISDKGVVPGLNPVKCRFVHKKIAGVRENTLRTTSQSSFFTSADINIVFFHFPAECIAVYP